MATVRMYRVTLDGITRFEYGWVRMHRLRQGDIAWAIFDEGFNKSISVETWERLNRWDK